MAGDQSFTDGEYIFREGESAVYAYIVKSGAVEITKHSASGVQVLAALAPPTIFGEMALIDGNPRSAGARAKGDTVVTEVTEEAPTETIAATEEVMEEQPEQSKSTTVATVQEEPESEPSSNEQVAVDVQDVQTQVAVKIKAIDKQLAATNIIGAQLMEAQQVDLSSYNKSYTDNRKIYEGNTYEDLRTLDEYNKKIYNDTNKFVAISMNDPVKDYQNKLRNATIQRQIAERELKQLRGY